MLSKYGGKLRVDWVCGLSYNADIRFYVAKGFMLQKL